MDLLQLLSKIPDPEIPVVNIVELGIVRDAFFLDGESVQVLITPTYTACPAMYAIKQDIEKLLREQGLKSQIKTVYAPAWTTDWITADALEKLRQFGISPPGKVDEELSGVGKTCPRCGSNNTRQVSRFGSTLCKAAYQCNDCLEPFDYFKCH